MSLCVKARRARPLLGTLVEITAVAADEAVLRRALAVAFIAVAEVQRLMSRYDPGSEVSCLNRNASSSSISVHRWTCSVLRMANRFSEESGGAFDITLGAGGSWRDLVIDKQDRVRFRRPITINLGGIAKGFAVDRAVEAMKKAGAVAGVVNAGGDLRVFGEKSEAILIRHPLNPGGRAGRVLLRERSLATSAHYFTPELFDGRSGAPILDEVSVTVGADDCATADALTKIALALREGARSVLERHHADAFLLERNCPAQWLTS
ncbi:MAG: FAD:protein FMN transferase [Chthoniobacterales bacterium]